MRGRAAEGATSARMHPRHGAAAAPGGSLLRPVGLIGKGFLDFARMIIGRRRRGEIGLLSETSLVRAEVYPTAKPWGLKVADPAWPAVCLPPNSSHHPTNPS